MIAAGINDWGGVSPLTPDYVNPEAPWPHLERLAAETAAAGKFLEQRLTVYGLFTHPRLVLCLLRVVSGESRESGSKDPL